MTTGAPVGHAPARSRSALVVFFVAGLLLTVLLVVYTVLHRPPRLPADTDHVGVREAAVCLDCHGPGKRSPRKPSHPPAESQCFNCHDAP